ncbi:MAG TPA: T9SS type B sorting domain-containing protein, partial [Chitinophagaceae bacterium]
SDGWIVRLSNRFFIDDSTKNAACSNINRFNVYFDAFRSFLPGNEFTVQLSDQNGDFSHASNIGNIASTQTDSILITLPSNLVQSAGYKLRVIASRPNDTSEIYSLWIHGVPAITLGNDTAICENSRFALSAGSQLPSSQFIWNTGSTDSSIVVMQPGVYWCQTDNGCGSARDSISIQVMPIPVSDIGPDTGFCKGNSIVLRSNPQLKDVSYLWNTGAIADSIIITTGGVYSLQVSNSCGNTTDSLLVTEYPFPNLNLDKNPTLCSGTTRLLSAGAGYTSYLWNDGSNSSTLSVNATGTYWVTVTNSSGCRASDTSRIGEIVPLPNDFLPADTSVCFDHSLLLKSNSNFETYLWSDGSTTSSISIDHSGIYWLEVTDEYGCQGKDSVVVNDRQCAVGFYMPTAFTPNNDGKNDVYRPMLFGNVIQFRFTIYDRWGKKIFETNDVQKGWDGKLNGTVAASDVYVWLCRYQLSGDQLRTEKGTVMLIR